MERSTKTPPPFQPIILGGDIGTYGLVRSFFEGWGVKSLVVTSMVLGPIQNSRLLKPVIVEGDDDSHEDFIGKLLEIGPLLKKKWPDTPLVLMANSDTNVVNIQNHADQLREFYLFSFPSLETIAETNDKAGFAKLAEKHGMNVPRTLEINLDDGLDAVKKQVGEAFSQYPLIIKASRSYGYEQLHWPGKAKVYTAGDTSEAAEILQTLEEHTAGHPQARHFVVQPRIEGNDTFNLSLTAYVDGRGEVSFLGAAHVLLEDHHPTALGNPAAMITETYPELFRQAEAFLVGENWRGFANFDVKVNRGTGEAFFFEVNPRIGRNLYYNTAAGNNPMFALVNDLLKGESTPINDNPDTVLYTVLPRSLLLAYTTGRVRAQVKELWRGKHFHPLLAPGEREWSLRYVKRRFYVWVSTWNHWRKFLQNFPPKALAAIGRESFETTPLTDAR